MDRRKDKSVKHPRVLVLGGGSGQLSLIRRLKRAGVSLIIQDRNPECIGRSLAEEFIRADTRDAAAAAAAAGRFKVDAVLTAGTDQPVYAASFAAAERGCPSLLDTETAKAVTDKEVMKKGAVGCRSAGAETSFRRRLRRKRYSNRIKAPVCREARGQSGAERRAEIRLLGMIFQRFVMRH
jgi:hypothetical protein